MTRTFLAIAGAALLAMPTTTQIAAQALEPIRYTLRFPAPQTHYVEVEAAFPPRGRAESRDLHGDVDAGLVPDSRVRAPRRSGDRRGRTRALAVEKSHEEPLEDHDRRRADVTVRYKVYSREMTVRNNWVESGFAMLNGAPTFITLVERAARPHEVRVELPAAWKRVRDRARCRRRHAQHLRAEDFDTLVDSPIIIGNPVDARVHRRRQAARRRVRGRSALIDADRAAADVQKIVVAGEERDGAAPLSALLLPHHGHRVGRRPRAQEQLPRHAGPLHDAHPRSLQGLARPDGARVLPQLERQAPAAGRAGPVRLRERKLREDAVGGRRASPTTTRTCCRARRPRVAGRVSRRALEPDRSRCRPPGPPGDAREHGVVRHVDQAVPPRREHRQHERELLPEGRGDRVPARCEDSQGHQRRAHRSTPACSGRCSAIPATRATRPISSTR